MRTKSPQRTRRIKGAALVGAVVGFLLGLVPYSVNGNWYSIAFFMVISTVMAAAITSMTATDYDFD